MMRKLYLTILTIPEVKESLKANLNAMMAIKITKDFQDNPFAAFGAALATAFINPMIDGLVTPENLAMLMKGEKPQSKKDKEDSDTSTSSKEKASKTSMGYNNLNKFIVTVLNKDMNEEPVKLVLRRHGIISWKLSALRFPSEFLGTSDSAKTSPASDKVEMPIPKPTEYAAKEQRGLRHIPETELVSLSTKELATKMDTDENTVTEMGKFISLLNQPHGDIKCGAIRPNEKLKCKS